MQTAGTLTAFGAGLALVFAAALGVGQLVGPVGAQSAGHGDEHAAPISEPISGPVAPVADGLSVSSNGYTLDLDQVERTVGGLAPLAFRIIGPGGQALTDYTPKHEKDLHLIVVRRDGFGFQHVHPTRDQAGRWSTPLRLPAAGTWKVFADFVPGDAEDGLTLTTDLTVPGTVDVVALPDETRSATVDGYTVELQGELEPGSDSPLTLSVSRNGQPVRDLQPYLGASGHLVVLRADDLAYLHVHPSGEQASGPEIGFIAEVPSAGAYRLYLDFKHAGVVRTAAFTLHAGGHS